MRNTLTIIVLSLFVIFGSMPVYGAIVGTTGTGLDKLIDIIKNDEGLNNRVYKKEDIKKNETWKITQEDINVGANSANEMNKIIILSIKATGIANDGNISAPDTRDLNNYINKNYLKKWIILHGNDEKTYERGFHRVQNDGGSTILYGENAINTIADSIYHLGFTSNNRNRILNEDKNNNATFVSLSFWLNDLLKKDIKSGKLNGLKRYEIKATSNSGLDKVIDIIKNDKGLDERVSITDKIIATYSSNEMNKLILTSIKATGIANDGKISTSDVRELNYYINKHYLKQWIKLHGNDEKTYETGYHRVQNDGGVTQIYGQNALNTVFDAIYHLGFTSKNNRVLNEDKNSNQKFSSLAFWLNDLLKNEIANGSLKNDSFYSINGTTNTGLDKIVDIINNDNGLNEKVKISDIMKGAKSANEMNKILVQAIKMTGAANDNFISVDDVKSMHIYIVKNYRKQWINLHGINKKTYKTGFDLVWRAGSSKKIFNTNAIDNIYKGIYDIGFSTDNDYRLKDENGKYSVGFDKVSIWLNDIFGGFNSNGDKLLSNTFFKGLNVVSGNWKNINDGYKGSDVDRVGVAIISNKIKKGNTIISLKMNFRPDGKNENGSIVFDYKGPKNYKIIGARADWNYWEVGEIVNGKYKKISVVKEKINVNQDYKIDVVFKGNFINLYVDNKLKIKSIIHMSSQIIGLSVNRSVAEFKSIVVQNF